MHNSLVRLLDIFDSPGVGKTQVIRWSSPVPAFGDPSTSVVATLGINPSNYEFTDEQGQELAGDNRRFHTLHSLGLVSWSEAEFRHIRLMIEKCFTYFWGNPYDRWFKRLDQVVKGTGASYYDFGARACHLDLIPYATSRKWSELTCVERNTLLNATGDELALIIMQSNIRILILNGRSVVDQFQDFAGIELASKAEQDWALPRNESDPVMGFSYTGIMTNLRGYDLGRKLLILGFNHNLQSSFGVTNNVINAIRSWVQRSTERFLQ